jgi:hypothetical protein
MAKKKKEKKKKLINPSLLNPDELRKKTIVYGLLGRAIASHGAVLTNLEKNSRELLYMALKAGRKLDEDPTYRAELGTDPRKNISRYTPAKALVKFKNELPSAAERLLAIQSEKHDDPRPQLKYGLEEGQEIDAEYAIQILQDSLGITRGPARQLYEKIIEPKLRKDRKESGLIEITMKE